MNADNNMLPVESTTTPKPGWLTSELWLTITFVATMAVAGIGAVQFGADHWAPKAAAMLSAALAVAKYTGARTALKSVE